MNFTNSYFHLISNEIQIKILKQISTYDLFQFCEAYNTDAYLHINDLVRNINLSRCYKLRNLQPLRKVNVCYIVTVNINGLYWLNIIHLRCILYRLVKLNNLFAIDTVLGLGEKDLLMYHQLKIKKLAISVNQSNNGTKTQVPTVETLFIKLLRNVRVPVDRIFPRVKALFFDEVETHWNIPPRSDFIQKSLYKTFGYYNKASASHEYESKRNNQPSAVLFDSINLPKKIDNIWPEEWQIFNELPPYPFRTLYALKDKKIDDIMLDELNFNTSRMCSAHEAIKKILSSPNTKFLKKLSIKICFLHYIFYCIQQEEEEQCCLLEKYSLQNLKYLEVLEIYKCYCTIGLQSDFVNCFSLISHLKHLKYLLFSLCLLTIDNAQFLIDILNNCQQLETLIFLFDCKDVKIVNIGLCTALKNANNLKNFHYFNAGSASVLDILNSFCSIENPKLERLSVYCNETKKWGSSELQSIERFFLKNPQLVLLYLNGLTCEQRDLVKPILSKYKEKHPAKRFVASYSERFILRTIADAHHKDMLTDTSIVSNPDIYQEVEFF